jgi:hypothetical protein
MTAEQLQLLLTVARILRAKIKTEIYAEQADDYWAIDQMLKPFDPAPNGATDETA